MLGAKSFFNRGTVPDTKAASPKAKLNEYQQRELDLLQAKYDDDKDDVYVYGSEPDVENSDSFKGRGEGMYEFVRSQILAGLSSAERELFEKEQNQLKQLALQIENELPGSDRGHLIAGIPAPERSIVEMVHARIRTVGENISRSLNLDPKYPYRF